MAEEELHRLRQAWRYAGGEARRAFLREVLRPQGLRGEQAINITSQVNAGDGAPAVLVEWEGEGRHLLMSVATAKRHALAILEVATGAEADAFLTAFVRERIDPDPRAGAMLMQAFREWREAAERRLATGEGEG